MNRIFIIGNGFDLAHGLPTSYNHFIDNFWIKIKSNYLQDDIKEVVSINDMYSGFLNYEPINSFEDIVSNIKKYNEEYGYDYDDLNYEYYVDKFRTKHIFRFENVFFKKLNTYKSINNWVDVENLYYNELKSIVKLTKRTDYETQDALSNHKKDLIVKLNKEFEQIKMLFIEYINDEVIEKYDFNDNQGSRFWENYHDKLHPFSIHFDNIKKIGFEFTSKDDVQELKNLYDDQKEGSFFNTALFLCFNYTPTVYKYFSIMHEDKNEVKMNYIHNRIQDRKGPIIFGFGDEMDDDYKLIENVNDNEYLKNFKSFQYLHYSNYNRLLNYINFNRFQVCILGHSCGLSDRVLLNTIFEHDNCRSIKVYYHESENGDNYTDIIQNISRHFRDKSLMRERVVNKEYSTPMIQIQIPEKRL